MDCKNTNIVRRSARRWIWLGCAVAAVAGSFAHSVQAIEPAKQVIPVGLSEFPPFEYKNASGKVVGADAEIVEAVLRRAGYVPDFKVQPWARIQQSALRGDFAMVFSMTKSKEREALYWFSEPINAVKDVFLRIRKPRCPGRPMTTSRLCEWAAVQGMAMTLASNRPLLKKDLPLT